MKNYAGITAAVQTAAALFCFIRSPLQAENFHLFNRIDVSTSISLSVPFDKIHDETESFTLYREQEENSQNEAGWKCRNTEDALKLCSLSTTAGMRVLFRDGEIRLYDTLPGTTFADLSEVSDPGDLQKFTDKPLYGTSLALTEYLHAPFVIQAGTLIPGGSWTRLSSPEFSSSLSPFAKNLSAELGLSSSLPGASSGKKLPAASVTTGVPETCRLLRGSAVSCFYREDGAYAASAVCCLNFPRMVRTAFSFTGGRFFLSGTSTSWFSDTCFFPDGWFPAFSAQAFFSSQIFLSVLTVNAYEQPAAGTRYTFRSENKLNIGRFTLMFAGFAADGKNIRCTDNSLSTVLSQLHITPLYTWRFASPLLPSVTAGVSCLVQYKYDRSSDCRYNDIKCTIGTQYADNRFSAGLTFTAADFAFFEADGEGKKAVYTAAARLSKTKGYFRTAVSGTCTFSDCSSEESFKLILGIQDKKISSSAAAAVSCSRNSTEYKTETASLVFTGSLSSKLMKYTVKLTLLGTF